MLNNSRTYTILVAGIAGGVFVVEALTNPLKKEEYYYSLNKLPDIPAENFIYSPLPYTGAAAVTTSGSGYIVNS